MASGPRHLVFHPNGRWVYNVNELDSTVDVLQWDAEAGNADDEGRAGVDAGAGLSEG